MFYKIIVPILKGIFWLIHGSAQVEGLEHVPSDRPVIIAATHRSLFDPFYIAYALYPAQIHFMGKDSLFKNPILAFLLKKAGMFPVNREKPGTAAIRMAIQVLNEDQDHLGIFPSGSRYTTKIKGGTAFIQRRSKADIIPVAIQPPLTFDQFFKRKKAKLAFGPAIPYQDDIKYTKEVLAQVDEQIRQAFDNLDQQLDPTYQYNPSVKAKK